MVEEIKVLHSVMTIIMDLKYINSMDQLQQEILILFLLTLKWCWNSRTSYSILMDMLQNQINHHSFLDLGNYNLNLQVVTVLEELNNEHFDNSNSYDNSNGTFTAPVAGS